MRATMTRMATGGLVMAAALLSMASDVSAQLGGPYISGRLVPALGNIDDLESRTTPGGAAAPDTVLVDDLEEFVAGAALAVGYDWRDQNWPIRTEIEYRYRYHFDWETQSAANNRFYNSSTRYSHALQANVAYIFGLTAGFDGYVLGGVGVRYSMTEGDVINRATNATIDGNVTTENTNLLWNVGGGVMWHFADNWSAELEYRYIDLGTLDFESGAGDRLTGEAYSHDFVLGLVYRL